MKRTILTVALILVAFFSLAFAYQSPQPKQWEYKIAYDLTEKKLNDLASQNWEVVGVGSGGTTINVPVYVLKRAKQ